jgi:hypothetical protein
MKIMEEITVYEHQGENAPGGTETQPADPGKTPSPHSLPSLTLHRLRQVALLRALSMAKGLEPNVSSPRCISMFELPLLT